MGNRGSSTVLFNLDTKATPVFGEFIARQGFYAIAAVLTRDGIPSPSAHDPAPDPPPLRHCLQ